MSKKVKEVLELHYVGGECDTDWCSLLGKGRRTYIYHLYSYENFEAPDIITHKIKRQPKTINEFLEVNDLLEVDVLEQLIKNYER